MTLDRLQALVKQVAELQQVVNGLLIEQRRFPPCAGCGGEVVAGRDQYFFGRQYCSMQCCTTNDPRSRDDLREGFVEGLRTALDLARSAHATTAVSMLERELGNYVRTCIKRDCTAQPVQFSHYCADHQLKVNS